MLEDHDSKLRFVYETFLCVNESHTQQRTWWNKHVETTMVYMCVLNRCGCLKQSWC